MNDKTIILGNSIVCLIEFILILRQLLKLKSATFSPYIKKIHSDVSEFEKMKNYNTAKLYLKIVESIFEIIKLYFLIKYKVLQYLLANITHGSDTFQQTLLLVLHLYIGNILSQPFSLFQTFVIEQKYGFNKTTFNLYLTDYIKTELISGLILGPVIYIVINLIKAYKDFYIPVYTVISCIQLILIVIFPVYIQPLFNKFTELEEGSLREQIVALAKKIGFKPSKILKMDGSKRSHHSNAYFVGLFKEKRVVLYDTLLEQTNESEVLAILCHEFGHWYHNHIFRQLIPSFLTTFLMIYGLNYYIKGSKEAIIISIIYFSWVFAFASPLVGLTFNYLTRILEREADVYAVRMGYGEELKSGLIKIHAENMSNLCPDKWFSTYHHSHPTLMERIELIDNEMKKIK